MALLCSWRDEELEGGNFTSHKLKHYFITVAKHLRQSVCRRKLVFDI